MLVPAPSIVTARAAGEHEIIGNRGTQRAGEYRDVYAPVFLFPLASFFLFGLGGRSGLIFVTVCPTPYYQRSRVTRPAARACGVQTISCRPFARRAGVGAGPVLGLWWTLQRGAPLGPRGNRSGLLVIGLAFRSR